MVYIHVNMLRVSSFITLHEAKIKLAGIVKNRLKMKVWKVDIIL